MKRIYFAIIIGVFIFSSCVTQHKTLSHISNWSYPQMQFDKQFSFSYADHILELTNNKRGAAWAKRKNIHIIAIKLTNNGDKPVHGIQLAFYNGAERAELIHNEWLAKKVRQRFSPLMVLFVPVWLVEDAFFHRDDDFENDLIYPHITEDVASQAEAKRKKANFDLRTELLRFQIANQVLMPNKEVYGIIGIRCKGDLKDLNVVKNDVDFEILSTQ